MLLYRHFLHFFQELGTVHVVCHLKCFQILLVPLNTIGESVGGGERGKYDDDDVITNYTSTLQHIDKEVRRMRTIH